MSYVQIKVGDTVYDRQLKVVGKVATINAENATATIDSLENKTTLLSNLFNLTVVEEMEEEKSNEMWQMVKDFHIAFNHPVSETPVQMEIEQATPRSVWTGEEALVEFIHASSKNQEEFDVEFNKVIEGLKKAKIKSDGMEYYQDGVDRIVAQSDALVDALYFILGSFVIMGVEPTKLFEAVQASNMSKLFDDGKPRFREEDGKILKSPNFFPPEERLEAEIKRQLSK